MRVASVYYTAGDVEPAVDEHVVSTSSCSTPRGIWHGPVSSDKSVKRNQVMRRPQGEVVKGGGSEHPSIIEATSCGGRGVRCSGARCSVCRGEKAIKAKYVNGSRCY